MLEIKTPEFEPELLKRIDGENKRLVKEVKLATHARKLINSNVGHSTMARIARKGVEAIEADRVRKSTDHYQEKKVFYEENAIADAKEAGVDLDYRQPTPEERGARYAEESGLPEVGRTIGIKGAGDITRPATITGYRGADKGLVQLEIPGGDHMLTTNMEMSAFQEHIGSKEAK